ncbi:MAG: hypothetical protein KA436_10545 [Oligoflexales bacterium]|nr:hypothetical protein [Oligoflexales bacterium]
MNRIFLLLLLIISSCKSIQLREQFKQTSILSMPKSAGSAVEEAVLKINYMNYVRDKDGVLYFDYTSSNINLYDRNSDISSQTIDQDFQDKIRKHQIQAIVIQSNGTVVSESEQKPFPKSCFRYFLDKQSNRIFIDENNDTDTFLTSLNPEREIMAAGDLCVDDNSKLLSFSNKSLYSKFLRTFDNFITYLNQKGLSIRPDINQKIFGLGNGSFPARPKRGNRITAQTREGQLDSRSDVPARPEIDRRTGALEVSEAVPREAAREGGAGDQGQRI